MIDPQTAQAAHPFIADWVKALITTLIGAVIGFMSAIASEVWKTRRSTHKRGEALERALYAEMSQLYMSLHYYASGNEDEPNYEMNALLIKQLRTDSYKFAKSNPDIFYTLKNAFLIDEIYSGLHLAQTMPELDGHKVCVFAYGFVSLIEMRIVQKQINIELFKHASPKTYDKVLQNIKEDEQKHPDYHKSLKATPGDETLQC